MKYEIVGDTLPVVICHLNKGEKMISDSGAMAWMDPCMKMETNGGGAGKIIGRMFSGETLFRNSYTANKDGLIAFASSFPGKIVAIDVEPGKEVIIQKSAFLASEENVETSVCFNKKFSSGIFGLFLEMVALKVAVRSFRELSLRTKAGDNIMAGDRTSRLMIFTKRC